jgi:hypothetical protein
MTVDRLRLLVVRFDDNGVVTDRWLQSYNCLAGQLPSVSRELHECPPPVPNTDSGQT